MNTTSDILRMLREAWNGGKATPAEAVELVMGTALMRANPANAVEAVVQFGQEVDA